MNNTKPIITLKIDVTKIEKDRLFKGAKGTYLDVVLIPAKENEFGNDYMVCQQVSKEEREAKKRGAILGSGRIIVTGAERPTVTPSSQPPKNDGDDVPF